MWFDKYGTLSDSDRLPTCDCDIYGLRATSLMPLYTLSMNKVDRWDNEITDGGHSLTHALNVCVSQVGAGRYHHPSRAARLGTPVRSRFRIRRHMLPESLQRGQVEAMLSDRLQATL
jgi:hypothetical protein